MDTPPPAYADLSISGAITCLRVPTPVENARLQFTASSARPNSMALIPRPGYASFWHASRITRSTVSRNSCHGPLPSNWLRQPDCCRRQDGHRPTLTKELKEWGHIAFGGSVGQPAPRSKWAKASVAAIAATIHKAQNSTRIIRLPENGTGGAPVRRQTGRMAC